ncbi:MAG TPA: serine hydrolase domain-containing protein [Thermoanaerobaculia bacterium]
MRDARSPVALAAVVWLASQRGLPAAPDAALTRRVDSLFASYDRRDSPGCALAVIHKSATVYTRGYGMASLELQVPISPRTVFDIGSTAKQFTAASILLLARDGKLSIDDDVRKFIPELPDYGATVTIRNLLQHTSGIPDYIDLLLLAGARTEDVVTDEEALHLLVLQPSLEFPPGSAHVYSNSGFFLLSLVVQRSSGQSLGDFARERVFAPLGMEQTGYVHDHTTIVPGHAIGYARSKGGGFRLDSSNWEQNGDGGLQTTVEDLVRWDQNFYDAKVGGRSLVDTLQSTGVLRSGKPISYAMGLRVDTYRGLKRVRHGGSWAGFRAELLRFPEERFSVATLCNLADASAANLARQVAEIYLDQRLSPETPAKVVPIASSPPEWLVGAEKLYWSRETDRVCSISAKGGALEYNEDAEKIELVPTSVGQWQSRSGSLSITLRDPASDIELGSSGADPVAFQPVDRWRPAPSELAAYAGSYWCRELESTYTIRIAGGRAVLVTRYGRNEPLEPVFPGAFRSDLAGLIRFPRNRNEVSGFEVLSGRTRLAFRRLSNATQYSPPK